MTREQMIENCVGRFSARTELEIAEAVLAYFEKNRTLPGEAALKRYAQSIRDEFTDGSFTVLMPDVKEDFLWKFAETAVKEVRVPKVRVYLENLPFSLSDITPIFPNSVNNTYALPVVVENGVLRTADTRTFLCPLPAGFYRNFKKSLKQGFLLATDYSNNHFRNMGYRFLTDLSQ